MIRHQIGCTSNYKGNTSGPKHILPWLPSKAHSEHTVRSHCFCTLENITQVKATSKLESCMVEDNRPEGKAEKPVVIGLAFSASPRHKPETGPHQEQQGTFISRRHH